MDIPVDAKALISVSNGIIAVWVWDSGVVCLRRWVYDDWDEVVVGFWAERLVSGECIWSIVRVWDNIGKTVMCGEVGVIIVWVLLSVVAEIFVSVALWVEVSLVIWDWLLDFRRPDVLNFSVLDGWSVDCI